MRKFAVTVLIASLVSAGHYIIHLGERAADVPGIELPTLGEAATVGSSASASPSAGDGGPPTDEDSARRRCYAPPPAAASADHARACELAAAFATEMSDRTLAWRIAADHRAALGEDAAAQALRLAAAASGDLGALVDHAEAGLQTAAPGHLQPHREALLAAAQSGAAGADEALDRLRATTMQGQAFSRPAFTVAMLEGRPLAVGDSVADRRYAMGYGTALERTCPFESAAIDTVGFRKAREQYGASLKTAGHVRLAGSLEEAAGNALRGVGAFASTLFDGQGYTQAGSELLHGWRAAQRRLDTAVSTGSEDGARDAVRAVSFVGGCGQPDGLRLIRALHALYAARATDMPSTSVTGSTP